MKADAVIFFAIGIQM